MTPIAARTEEIRQRLATLGVDADVIFGREGFTRDIPQRPRVHVLYDDAGDVYEPPGTVRGFGNGNTWSKWTGVFVHIMGASNVSGATEDDHKAVVEALVDAFVVTLQVIAHKNRNLVRDMKGAFLPPLEDAPAEYGSRYELQFQYGRAVIEIPTVKTTSTAIPAQSQTTVSTTQPPSTLGSGAVASVTAADGTKATIGGLTGMQASDVALVLTIAGGASSGNNGRFRITDFVDAATVKIANPSAVAPDGFNGHLSWTKQNAELVAA